MSIRTWLPLSLVGVLSLACLADDSVQACCPAFPPNKPVVNADQTVVIIWDAATQTQHFIRQASFKSDADDFGFLVPSPSQPVLSESGNDAFRYLGKLTEPEVVKKPMPSGGFNCGCGAMAPKSAGLAEESRSSVNVLEEKRVAGFHAAVLETTSTTALVGWLKDNGYTFSPEVEAWAKPYVEKGWKITALKVAKAPDDKKDKDVAASALRMSFKTDHPLFPYREPESSTAAASLGAGHRLLRIFFVADARYQGELTHDHPWTGRVAWSGKVNPEDRKKLLDQLHLPETTGPAQWWLTEFEDDWPYQLAPADVYFSRSPNQDAVKREPIIQYVSSSVPTDVTAYALAVAMFVPLLGRVRRGRKQSAW